MKTKKQNNSGYETNKIMKQYFKICKQMVINIDNNAINMYQMVFIILWMTWNVRMQ